MPTYIRPITSLVAADQRLLFDTFVELYTRSFPDTNERESPDLWAERLDHQNADGRNPTFFLHVLADDSKVDAQQNVLGGAVFEYYRHSACGLLTYIVVKESERGKGHARKLLRASIERLESHARDIGQCLTNVFAEANDPRKTPEDSDVIPPAHRLAIFASLGAKWIPIDYVQPALREGSERVRNLVLLCFPLSLETARVHVSGATLRVFLDEFYRSLGVSDPVIDPDCRHMVSHLADTPMVLCDPPLVESPTLRFSRVAVCLHAVDQSASADGTLSVSGDHNDGNFFRSFEIDLLSYRFQASRPFETKCISSRPVNVLIHYPPDVRYETEGRRVSLSCPPHSRTVSACCILSATEFAASKVRIYHLAFSPQDTSAFTEYDIIKLAKLYGGTQEANDLATTLAFSLPPEHTKISLSALLLRLCGNSSAACFRAGTVELDASSCEGIDLVAALRSMRAAFAGDSASETALHNAFDEAAPSGIALKALCGIVTSIFDFGRMSFAEALDTLEPTVCRGTGIIRIHRGTLLALDETDDLLRTVWRTIGVSPYLVIPQAVLLHNDALVDLAEGKLKTVVDLRDLPGRVHQNGRLHKLESVRQDAERCLDLDYVPNVFQYPTERQIVDDGAKHRGSPERADTLRRQLQNLSSTISDIRAERAARADASTSILLAILSGMTIQPLLFAIAEALSEPERVPLPHRVAWGVFMLGVVGLTVFFVSTKRAVCRRC